MSLYHKKYIYIPWTPLRSLYFNNTWYVIFKLGVVTPGLFPSPCFNEALAASHFKEKAPMSELIC